MFYWVLRRHCKLTDYSLLIISVTKLIILYKLHNANFTKTTYLVGPRQLECIFLLISSGRLRYNGKLRRKSDN